MIDDRRVLAAAKNMVFVSPTRPASPALADPVLIRLMLDNLIDNAIKYGRNDGASTSVFTTTARCNT